MLAEGIDDQDVACFDLREFAVQQLTALPRYPAVEALGVITDRRGSCGKRSVEGRFGYVDLGAWAAGADVVRLCG